MIVDRCREADRNTIAVVGCGLPLQGMGVGTCCLICRRILHIALKCRQYNILKINDLARHYNGDCRADVVRQLRGEGTGGCASNFPALHYTTTHRRLGDVSLPSCKHRTELLRGHALRLRRLTARLSAARLAHSLVSNASDRAVRQRRQDEAIRKDSNSTYPTRGSGRSGQRPVVDGSHQSTPRSHRPHDPASGWQDPGQ